MAAENHLLLYEYVADMAQRRMPYREAHLAHLGAARAAGHVGLAGALGTPPHGGAIQFTGVVAADVEAFVQADPYQRAGLVRAYRIEPWTLV